MSIQLESLRESTAKAPQEIKGFSKVADREEINIDSLHTCKLKVVRRYMINIFKIVIMINLDTLKKQKLCKNYIKKTKNTSKG